MSKTLIVVRHGHADPGEADFARQLSQRGVSEANATGKRLAERGIAPDAVLTSTAPRALETAIAVAGQCGFDGEVQRSDALYLAEPTTILRSVRTTADAVQTLLVVGHNPGLSALVELLTGQMCELHTAEAVQLKLQVEHWRDAGL
jgi:phosphohistidine phosphatase